MKNQQTNKRVILITGDNTKWYEQAIFIVKKNTAKNDIPTNFVSEAEKIIESYMLYGKGTGDPTKVEYALSDGSTQKYISQVAGVKTNRRDRGSFDFMLNFVMLLACCFLAGVLAYLFFN